MGLLDFVRRIFGVRPAPAPTAPQPAQVAPAVPRPEPRRQVRAAERVLVLGKAGSGKSWWVKSQVRARQRSKPVLIWDPEAEYAGARAERGVSGARVFHSTRALIAGIRASAPGAGSVLVVQSVASDFPPFAELVSRAGNCWLIVDEAHRTWRSTNISKEALYLGQVCRHRGVDLWLIAQRPFGIHPDLRENKTRVVAFRLEGRADQRWLGDNFGADAENRLRALPEHGHLELV